MKNGLWKPGSWSWATLRSSSVSMAARILSCWASARDWAWREVQRKSASNTRKEGRRRIPAGARAPIIIGCLLARLKSCPVLRPEAERCRSGWSDAFAHKQSLDGERGFVRIGRSWTADPSTRSPHERLVSFMGPHARGFSGRHGMGGRNLRDDRKELSCPVPKHEVEWSRAFPGLWIGTWGTRRQGLKP